MLCDHSSIKDISCSHIQYLSYEQTKQKIRLHQFIRSGGGVFSDHFKLSQNHSSSHRWNKGNLTFKISSSPPEELRHSFLA